MPRAKQLGVLSKASLSKGKARKVTGLRGLPYDSGTIGTQTSKKRSMDLALTFLDVYLQNTLRLCS
jgi:hypothetical protein